MASPNFFIVGSVKCGTTWLYDSLAAHPDVFMSWPKEPHYFSQAKHRPFKSYMKHIHDKSSYYALFDKAGSTKAIGEASTSYLWDENALQRIRETHPSSKIIAILRDPIDRAYSHYLMDVREGVQRLPFYEALLQDEAEPTRSWHTANLYVDLGLYAQQISRLFRTFPASQIRVFSFADIVRNPYRLINETIDFLEIQRFESGNDDFGKKSNAFALPRNQLASRILGSERIRKSVRWFLPYSTRRLFKRFLMNNNAVKPSIDDRSISYLRTRLEEDLDSLPKIEGLNPADLRRNLA